MRRFLWWRLRLIRCSCSTPLIVRFTGEGNDTEALASPTIHKGPDEVIQNVVMRASGHQHSCSAGCASALVRSRETFRRMRARDRGAKNRAEADPATDC